MDVTQAVLTTLYHHLRDDQLLADAVGEHYEGPYARTPEDARWPYLWHRLDTLEGADNATRPATYTIEVWDYGQTLDRIWRIRARLNTLLDHARLNASSQGIIRLWFASETSMPSADRNVMTLALTYTLRYARAGEVRAIQQLKGT